MNILVTGASGFLGHFLTQFLKDKGHYVVGLSSRDCDLKHPSSLDPWNSIQFDQIYHLAVWTQAGDFCLKYPTEQWIVNQKINTHMLDWWIRKQPQAKLIAMGTSCAYDPAYPLSEDNYLKGTPIESLLSYGMTKKMLLVGLMAAQKQHGLNYLYLIPSTLYGPNYHTDGRQMHFIFDLIQKILRGQLYQDPVILWGDGEQKREVVQVKDFLPVMWELAQVCKNEVVNVGAGVEYSIKEFAHMICHHVGYSPSQIQFDLSRYVGARSKVLSIAKLKQLLPHYRPAPVQEGVKEVVAWFRERM